MKGGENDAERKQIEEMTAVIDGMEECEAFADGDAIAKVLYDKGYRKQSEVAIEIFDAIEKCMEHDYISSIGVYNGALKLRIVELKKKYTGEKEDAEIH